ncbi:MAG: V-type ATP synthase subunit A [Rubrivivax sp.]|nr:V-type ATP synthase subunit A [Rubrivivax sp.]
MSQGTLTRVVGALAEASGMRDARLNELVRVGHAGLQGEVLRVAGDSATLQVFEDTGGLALGEPVQRTGGPLVAELGPGLLATVFDGVGRPLARLAAAGGDFMAAGVELPTLDRSLRYEFRPAVAAGSEVGPGDLLGEVDEHGLAHRVLVPPGRGGRLRAIRAGAWRVDETFAEFDDGTPLTLLQRWPVRRPRPVAARLPCDRPFVTGQRIFDFLFPVAEGGVVAVPGGFGTGKTVIEQSLAKFADADVVVYVGCGERGNEMAELLADFARLKDPRRGTPALDRTVLVVNTSNMPVAAREASIYLGLTIAEYYRDMGWRVAVMADSLSRWAEALREIGSRLQQMPGEEGYPTYLASRVASLHERAGRVRCAGAPERCGAVTLIGAVSPPGGDFSEPVTQACMRVAGALWALDAELAHQRQFPAVDWHASYSLYAGVVQGWFAQATDARWPALRAQILALLQRDAELREVAAIVGARGAGRHRPRHARRRHGGARARPRPECVRRQRCLLRAGQDLRARAGHAGGRRARPRGAGARCRLCRTRSDAGAARHRRTALGTRGRAGALRGGDRAHTGRHRDEGRMSAAPGRPKHASVPLGDRLRYPADEGSA